MKNATVVTEHEAMALQEATAPVVAYESPKVELLNGWQVVTLVQSGSLGP